MKTFGYIDLNLIVSLIHITIIIKKSPYLYKFITSCSKVSLFPIALLRIYNRENETYNFLKRNVQFSLFFHPTKTKAFNHHSSGN